MYKDTYVMIIKLVTMNDQLSDLCLWHVSIILLSRQGVNSSFDYSHFQISKYKFVVTLGLVINHGEEGIQNRRGGGVNKSSFTPTKTGVDRKGLSHAEGGGGRTRKVLW